MHALTRGDLLQRLRLATGLILFTFAATHFLNHALGLVSLEAMHAMQDWRKAVTRTWPGSIVLLGAFVTHIALALYKIAAGDVLGHLHRHAAPLAGCDVFVEIGRLARQSCDAQHLTLLHAIEGGIRGRLRFGRLCCRETYRWERKE
ncbi:MAG: hypothetical protein WAO08_12080 [Hyphomicrobiaceae bacterium]